MTARHIVIALSLSAAAPALAAWPVWMPQYGDARCAQVWTNVAYMRDQPGKVLVAPPAGDWNAITCTMWVRLQSADTNLPLANMQRTTGAFWTPEPIRRTMPDLTSGAFGFPDGTNLVDSAAISYSFAAAASSAPSNVFARGAYTINGWSSNAVTLTLGGADIPLGPGEFNRNALPGVSDGIILSGTGQVAVGIGGPLHPHQFFGASDGVTDEEQKLTPESLITNEMVFLSFRLRLDNSNHIYRCDMARLDWDDQMGQIQTNALPDNPAVRSLSADGLYYFGFDGLGSPSTNWSFDAFDIRLQTRWLNDAEIERVYRNGAEEVEARAIPRWR